MTETILLTVIITIIAYHILGFIIGLIVCKFGVDENSFTFIWSTGLVCIIIRWLVTIFKRRE